MQAFYPAGHPLTTSIKIGNDKTYVAIHVGAVPMLLSAIHYSESILQSIGPAVEITTRGLPINFINDVVVDGVSKLADFTEGDLSVKMRSSHKNRLTLIMCKPEFAMIEGTRSVKSIDMTDILSLTGSEIAIIGGQLEEDIEIALEPHIPALIAEYGLKPDAATDDVMSEVMKRLMVNEDGDDEGECDCPVCSAEREDGEAGTAAQGPTLH